MMFQSALKAAFQKRPAATRWVYVPVALITALFGLMAWHDGGAWLYVLLLLVCLIQSVYPTIFGWGLLFTPCAVYTVAVAVTLQNGPGAEYVFFLLCGAVPAAVLFFGKPKIKS
jgi:hypothetical protein